MKKRIIRLCIGAAVFVGAAASAFLPLEEAVLQRVRLGLFLTAYLIVGYKVIWKAVRNIAGGKVFDENFLMAVASAGAFFVGDYPEAVAVMLFYQVGELFEDYAVGRSRKNIADLMNIRPDSASLKVGDEIRQVDPAEVSVGDVILVRPGEKIPLDGRVLEGDSLVDTAALTGESVPREVSCGVEVLSGCINLSGVLTIEVSKPFGESTVSKILDLVENATMKKARTENFITRFAAVYTPVVVIAAVVLAVLPPLVIPGAVFSDWLYRALNFLVVSCPCALVISVPLSFFGGIGGASRAGVLVKGSNYLEAMASAQCVVMDKTGTLTRGVFEVERICPAEGFTKEQLLECAALAESYSPHPISASLKRAWAGAAEAVGKTGAVAEMDAARTHDVEEISGHGVKAVVDLTDAEIGKEGSVEVAAGNARLMEKLGLEYSQDEIAGTAVHVAIGGRYAGYIVIADQLKEDAAEAVAALKNRGIRTVMLTGDSKAAGEAAADALGMDQVYAELLPGDKVAKVESLLRELAAETADGAADSGGKGGGSDGDSLDGDSSDGEGGSWDRKGGSKRKGRLVFVGDGINDAPVLARADVGIAMGGLGSDAAIEAADIVIMNDEPSKIALIMDISCRTMAIVRQNIVFALGVKALVLILSAVGLANMWAAVFADVGVSMLAILNSFRAMQVKQK
ncbi:MAG: heavy metal translocating P-type ATPase [Firmicutes bacterium]|nr:heavy metal translocating P-type ATPase [Bacillota bacterium]MDY5857469.1 heavy metal translocating P-type ATPase [Anaerovoracaceae bacterium]